MNLHGDYSLVIGGPIIGGYCDYVSEQTFASVTAYIHTYVLYWIYIIF